MQNSSQTGLARVEITLWPDPTADKYNEPKSVDCIDPWSACAASVDIHRIIDATAYIYQLRGLDQEGNVQCLDYLNLNARYGELRN